ncbi:hypothetical protein ACRZ29_000256 [Edwardsiella piscicida]
MTFFAHCFHMISIVVGFVIFLLGVLGLSLWVARLFTSDNEANLVIVFISIAIMVFFLHLWGEWALEVTESLFDVNMYWSDGKGRFKTLIIESLN